MAEAVKILVHFCPYCGSQDVKELNRVQGPGVETVTACCFTCNEDFVVDRKTQDEVGEE